MDNDAEYMKKLRELDHLLNDPDAPIQPGKVWSLLADISEHDLSGMSGTAPETRAN